MRRPLADAAVFKGMNGSNMLAFKEVAERRRTAQTGYRYFSTGVNQEGKGMDSINDKIARLESETSQIRVDVAALVERSKHAANQASLDALVERCEGFASQASLDALAERCEGFASQAALDKLIERSENFATKADLYKEIGLVRTDLHTEIGLVRTDLHKEIGLVRTDLQKEIGSTRVELLKEISASEQRLNTKFDVINNRITWTLLLPALTAIILWFVKVAILKI